MKEGKKEGKKALFFLFEENEGEHNIFSRRGEAGGKKGAYFFSAIEKGRCASLSEDPGKREGGLHLLSIEETANGKKKGEEKRRVFLPLEGTKKGKIQFT